MKRTKTTKIEQSKKLLGRTSRISEVSDAIAWIKNIGISIYVWGFTVGVIGSIHRGKIGQRKRGKQKGSMFVPLQVLRGGKRKNCLPEKKAKQLVGG